MEFNIFICAAVYVTIAIAFFLSDETDFALIWLLFMPIVFVYLEATMGKSSMLSEGVLIVVYDLLSDYFLLIMTWITTFLIIYLWRNGFLHDVHARITDVLRPNHTTGYTPEKFKGVAPISSALMGASTSNFVHKPLSVRDTAFIDLSVYALQVFNQQTNVIIVNQMRLSSEYYKSIHSRIAGRIQSGSGSVPDMVRPFMRETAGNYDMPHKLLSDLCEVARMTGNTDQWTRLRLNKIAKQLKQPTTIIDRTFC